MDIPSKQFAVVILLLTLVLFVCASFKISAIGFTTIEKRTHANIYKLSRNHYVVDKINMDGKFHSLEYNYLSPNLSSLKSKKVVRLTVLSHTHEAYSLRTNRTYQEGLHNRRVYDIATVKLSNLNKVQPIVKEEVILQHNSRQLALKEPSTNYLRSFQLLADNSKATTTSQNAVSLHQNKIGLSSSANFTANRKQANKKSIRSAQLPTITSSSITDKYIVTNPFNSIAYGDHQVAFMYQQGRWLAYIKQSLAIGYRYQILPVYGEFGFSIEKLLNSAPDRQKEYTHIYPTIDSNTNTPNYVYIGKLKSQDYGIKIDIGKNINNLTIAYSLIDPSNFNSDTLRIWKDMLAEIGNILAGIKINLTVVTIDPDPAKVKTKLEQIIYKFLHRQVRLENYSLVYNKLLAHISNQMQLLNKNFDYRSSNFYENYTVDLQVSLQKISSLLTELNRVKSVPKSKVARFDLNKLYDALEINVSIKELTRDSIEGLQTNIEYFSQIQDQEEVQLSVLPSLSLQPSYLQAFVDNNINNYPMLVEQSGEVPSSNSLYLEEYDLPTSMHIPHLIRLSSGSTVTVTFGSSLKKPENLIISADRLVDQRLIPSLIQALNKANETVKIESIHISATTNGHDGKQYANSNHRKENGARAIDISRINSSSVASLGANNPLVIALQSALEEVSIVRENFGPYLRHKNKKPYTTSRLRENHKNHIHFSINR
ncbi:hypothetical protein Aasi_0168 [Candidatus Amoebophilus asiaticus 5a2]|uniref:Uncharacterized protein n=2 Tax=Candidatus Amoebophilus asiaticus TaxID=281120 RepID=B3EUJ4_AMOA5|nr:hypothetical protein Aasi_0168 [Candidatus Amoebophilus asiaticus 5a2]